MPGGRPSKFTEELADELCSHIEKGRSYEMAADLCKIARSTFYDWIEKGDAGDERFSGFSDSVKRASALSACRWLEGIESGMQQWQSQAWLVERRRPEWRMPKEQNQAPQIVISSETAAWLSKQPKHGDE